MENGPGWKMYFLLLKSGGFSSLPCLPEGTVNGKKKSGWKSLNFEVKTKSHHRWVDRLEDWAEVARYVTCGTPLSPLCATDNSIGIFQRMLLVLIPDGEVVVHRLEDPLKIGGYLTGGWWDTQQKNWVVVVSNIFHLHPYLGKWSNLTNVFQMGWFNHQLESCGFLGLNRWNSIFEPTLIREWGGMRCVFFVWWLSYDTAWIPGKIARHVRNLFQEQVPFVELVFSYSNREMGPIWIFDYIREYPRDAFPPSNSGK